MFAPYPSFALCAFGLLVQPFVLAQQSSQTFTTLPNTLPACAQTCPLLQQALGTCQSNPQAAASCFCQSGLLAPVKTTDNNICAPQCADADWANIESWYKSFCANPASPGQGQTTTTTPGTPTQTSSTTTSAAPEAAATTSEASYLGSDDINKPESGSQWWSNHWEWVLMVIILVVAFTAIGVGGTIWHKRRKRRREGWDDPRPAMSAWAPSQHSVHDFGTAPQGPVPAGAGAPPVPPVHGRGKGKERATVSAAPPAPQSPPPGAGRKLRKVLGRG